LRHLFFPLVGKEFRGLRERKPANLVDLVRELGWDIPETAAL